jgi:hypothetical protein
MLLLSVEFGNGYTAPIRSTTQIFRRARRNRKIWCRAQPIHTLLRGTRPIERKLFTAAKISSPDALSSTWTNLNPIYLKNVSMWRQIEG